MPKPRKWSAAFFVIEAADKEEAIRIASLHPAATPGEHIGWGIELHPIGTCSVKK